MTLRSLRLYAFVLGDAGSLQVVGDCSNGVMWVCVLINEVWRPEGESKSIVPNDS
jgi:hypothetical protein